jgi:periplasmic mercuric ion binding protein
MKTKLFVLVSILLVMGFSVKSFSQEGKKKKTETARITASMHCQACADNITTNLMMEPGIKVVNADPVTKVVEVVYNPRKTNPEKIVAKIIELGYSAAVIVE